MGSTHHLWPHGKSQKTNFKTAYPNLLKANLIFNKHSLEAQAEKNLQ